MSNYKPSKRLIDRVEKRPIELVDTTNEGMHFYSSDIDEHEILRRNFEENQKIIETRSRRNKVYGEKNDQLIRKIEMQDRLRKK